MGSVSLGPLAIPLAPLLLLVAYGVATVLARWVVAAAHRPAAESVVWWAFAAGVLVARSVHVGLHAADYAADPWAVLDLRDAGFHAGAGVAAALAMAGWRLVKWPEAGRLVRQRVALVLIATVGLWWSAGAILHHQHTVQAVALQDLSVLLEPWSDAAAAPDPRAPPTPQTPGHIAAQATPRRVVINLWASWCGPCRAEMPLLAAAQARHPDVLFLFVNQGEPAEAIQRYVARERLALRQVWRDPSGALGRATGANSLPTTLVYDATGRLLHRHVGALNAPGLAALLR